MRTAGPTTGAAFARMEFLDRALDPADARRSLFGRNDPTNPFVPSQSRQIFPGGQRRRFRAKGGTQVRRGFVRGTWFAMALHCHSLQRVKITTLCEAADCLCGISVFQSDIRDHVEQLSQLMTPTITIAIARLRGIGISLII
jgi:hypothetical protein